MTGAEALASERSAAIAGDCVLGQRCRLEAWNWGRARSLSTYQVEKAEQKAGKHDEAVHLVWSLLCWRACGMWF